MQVNVFCVDVKRALSSTGVIEAPAADCKYHRHTSAPQQRFQQHTPPKPCSTTLGLLLDWH